MLWRSLPTGRRQKAKPIRPVTFGNVRIRGGLSRNYGRPYAYRETAGVVPSARKHAGHRETIRIVSRKGRRDERRGEVAREFIPGSSGGLGLMAARLLIDQGHEVVLHGRNEGRSPRR